MGYAVLFVIIGFLVMTIAVLVAKIRKLKQEILQRKETIDGLLQINDQLRLEAMEESTPTKVKISQQQPNAQALLLATMLGANTSDKSSLLMASLLANSHYRR